MAGKLNLIPLVVVALPVFGQSPPQAPGISQFESSAFCHKYHCVRSGAIEPVIYSGAVREYVYTYRTAAEFVMRVTTSGKRTNPYMIVRPRSITQRDLAGIKELVDRK